MKLILRYLKPHFQRMVVGFFIKFTGTIMDLALPWILAYIIDEIVPQNSMNKVLLWGLVMFFCAVIAVLGNVIANRIASAVARDAIRVVRNDVFTKIMSLSGKQIDQLTEGSLISRMTNDTYNIHQIMSTMQRLGTRAPILLIGGIIVTMTLDPVLASILVATLPLLGIVVFYVARKGIPLYQVHQKASDIMIGKVRENISGIRVIKALSKTGYEEDQFEKINMDVVKKEKKAGITMALTSPFMNLLLNIGWILVILIGAYRVNQGLIGPGKIIAFLTYFTIILNAMLSITRLFVMYTKAGSSAGRLEELLNQESELYRIESYSKEADTLSPAIEFQNVSFSYNGTMDNVQNVSFRVKKNATIGIIGATGSGKTTLIRLLMRFYDVNSGSIKVDGQDVRGYEPTELHQKFGVVFQNDMLFEDTIAENIRLGREVTDEQIREAAKCAMIDSHIESMEDGYESFVAIKGNNLSGGQKQRLLIARAIVNQPQILILDDSSSALDYKTDACLRKSVRSLLSNTTIMIIAQRASSVMNCDQILMIDEGKIAGIGTHQELLNSCQEYSEIYRLQSK